MSSKKIENELNSTVRRIGELTEMRQAAADNFQKSQNDFIKAKISLEALQVEQSKLDLLDSSLQSLEARKVELQSELETVQKNEKHADSLTAMKNTAKEAQQLFNECSDQHAEFDKAIAAHGEKLLNTLIAFRGKQREFAATLQRIIPGILPTGSVHPDQRDIFKQTARELEAIGVSEKLLSLMRENYLQFPVLENGETIGFALRVLENRIDTEARKNRYNERRAKTGA